MALDNYADLQAEIAVWLRRPDLTAEIPTFITLAEAQLNRALRSTRMITRNNAFVINAQSVALPADFVGIRSLRLPGASPPNTLRWVSVDEMDELLDTTDYTAGPPTHYTVEGASLRLSPDPGATSYTAALVYYASLPTLAANTTNWLLASHPDAYLYGSLMQSAPYVRADDRLAMWGEMFTRIVADINASDTGMGGALSPQPQTSFAGYI